MAYQKQNFVDGNVLTADNLNHMEEGIAAAAPAGYGLGTTAKEILDANTAVTNGWYKLTSVNVADAHIPFQYVMIHVTAYDSRYVVQDLYRTIGTHYRRIKNGDTWGEWVNMDTLFAPAGYGLGEADSKLVDNPDKAIRPGFYHVSNGDYNGGDWRLCWCSLLVERQGARILQTARYNNLAWFRYSEDSGATWQPWEWVNPPMALGVEYRTTERWNGKVVYTKLIDFGALPNTTEKTVGHDVYPMGLPLSVTVTAKKDNWSFTLPSDHSIETKVLFNAQGVTVATTLDRSDYNAYATLKYTKD